jgi:phosphatidylserine/phosphatidylglycerophosphate/cardiolipin synthase-like enzyme
MSIKRKFLYFSVPFILISFGFYYLNHTNTGDYKRTNPSYLLDFVQLDKKKFEIPISNTDKIDNNNANINKNNNKSIESEPNNDSGDIIALFSPRSDIRNTLISYIAKEPEGIICAAFRLTDQPITKAFLSAHEKGTKLTFIIDKEGLSSMHSKVLHLFNLGVPLYIFPPIQPIDDTPMQGLMHNKIILFLGQKIVITGSFNFTKSAQDRNRENIVIIKNNPIVFNTYLSEMYTIMAESSKFQSQLSEKKIIKKDKKNKTRRNKKK